MCKKCRAVKTLKVHHCSLCNKCVDELDHHCPWVGNCVAKNNIKYFVLFNMYVTLLSTIVFGGLIHNFI